jgi:hypothetical protein
MDVGDREGLRQAAASVEAGESWVLGMIGDPGGPGSSPPRMTEHELATLREVAFSLRTACTRLWSLCDEDSRDED